MSTTASAATQGMVKMPVDGVEKDYVKIAYAGADVLYVPATQLDLVSKYIGGGEDANETRKLSRLGGTDWEKQSPGPRRRCRTWPRASSSSTPSASASPASPFPRTPPG